MIRQEGRWNKERKEKSNTSKTNNTLGGNKAEGTGERRNTKKISRQDKKKYRYNIPKQRKQFYQQVGGECSKTNQQQDDKETKQFSSKIWERREHNRKAEWISNMEKELQGLSLKGQKGCCKGTEVQEGYYILVNTSSR